MTPGGRLGSRSSAIANARSSRGVLRRSPRTIGSCCSGAAEKPGTGDDGGEGGDLQRPSYARRQGLIEEHEPGSDRNRVRDQGCDAGSGQRAAMLERRLEHTGAGRVAGNQWDDRDQPDSPQGDELRGDVSVGEEEPRCKAERGGPREADAHWRSERLRPRQRPQARSRRRHRAVCVRRALPRPATLRAEPIRAARPRRRAARGSRVCSAGRAPRGARGRRCLTH